MKQQNANVAPKAETLLVENLTDAIKAYVDDAVRLQIMSSKDARESAKRAMFKALKEQVGITVEGDVVYLEAK